MQEIRNEASSLFSAVISPSERRRAERAVRATYAGVVKTPGDASEDLKRLYQTLLGNDGVLGADDERQAKQYLMQRLELPQADADRVLANWKEQYEKATSQLQQAVLNLRKEVMPDDNAPSNAVPGATGNTETADKSRTNGSALLRSFARPQTKWWPIRPTRSGSCSRCWTSCLRATACSERKTTHKAKALLKRQNRHQRSRGGTGLEPLAAALPGGGLLKTGRAVQEGSKPRRSKLPRATTDAIATASALGRQLLSFWHASLPSSGGMLGRPEDWLHLRAQVRDLRGPRGIS